MSNTVYLNIHNCLKVQIDGYRPGIAGSLDNKFSFFNCPQISNPDIHVQVVNQLDARPKGLNVDHEFYFSESDMFFGKTLPVGSFSALVKDWSHPALQVFYQPINTTWRNGYRWLMPFYSLFEFVLQPLLFNKLSELGFHVIHAGALRVKGKTVLLLGRGGSFKSTLCFRSVKEGAEFLGDDFVLVKEGQVYAFPLNLKYFQFLLQSGVAHENAAGPISKLKWLINNKVSNWSDLPIPISSPVDVMIFLSPEYHCPSPQFFRLETHQANIKARLNQELESYSPINPKIKADDFLDALSLCFPNNKLKRNHYDLNNLFHSIDTEEFKIPYKWDEEVYRVFKRRLG